MPFPTQAELVARYYDLCDKRDALYAKAQPLEDQLTAVNEKIEPLRIEAEQLASQIDTVLGREKFLALKKEIGQIATFLRKIPPRTTS